MTGVQTCALPIFISSSDNVLVRGIADALKSDAMTHRELLGVVEDVLSSTITLTPEELGDISSLLDDFVDTKKTSLEMAAHERTSGTHFVVSKLLDLILEDEKKYDKFRDEFNEFKVKIYPYGIS